MTTADPRSRRLLGSWIGSLDDGFRSRKALFLLLAPWPLLALVVSIAVANDVPPWQWQLIALWLAVFLVFVSSAGCVLSDVARGVPERRLADALLTGAYGAVMILLSLLLTLLLFAIWLLGVAFVLYLSKLPVLGPAIYAVSVPLAIIGTGTTVIGLLYFSALVPPAVWEGRGPIDATWQALSLVEKKVFETSVNVVVLFFIFGMAVSFLLGVILWGAFFVIPMALGIVYGALHGFAAFAGVEISDGPNLVALILLIALTNTMLLAAFLGAINGMYLELAEGLGSRMPRRASVRAATGHDSDVAWEQRKEQAKVVAGKIQATVKEAVRGAQVVVGDAGARVKQGLHDAQARAQELAQRQREEQSSEKDLVCENCGAQVSASDAFCGSCGNRLRVQKPAEESES